MITVSLREQTQLSKLSSNRKARTKLPVVLLIKNIMQLNLNLPILDEYRGSKDEADWQHCTKTGRALKFPCHNTAKTVKFCTFVISLCRVQHLAGILNVFYLGDTLAEVSVSVCSFGKDEYYIQQGQHGEWYDMEQKNLAVTSFSKYS